MSHTSWVDLVDVQVDDRVLVLDGAGRRSEPHLQHRAADVTFVTGTGTDTDTPDVVVAALQRGDWDYVCLDGVDVDVVPRHLWATALAPGARVVVVGDHLASPLRVLDGLSRGQAGPGARLSHRSVVRRLSAAGLSTQQIFGLLRSSDEPVVAFDSLATTSLPAVMGATLAHVHGWRAAVLDAATRLSARQVLRLCPGWVVIAGATRTGPPDRVVGKVSNRDSHEVKLLRGEPVSSIERRYLGTDTHPTAEVDALQELEEAGFTLAPRLLSPPSSRVNRCSWLPGDPLSVARLEEAELVAWVSRAAEVLAELQSATRAADGTVLVHGDYWLGNLLTHEDRVSGVVDWTEAHRGSQETDRTFLVTSLERWITSEPLRRRLERARDEVLGEA